MCVALLFFVMALLASFPVSAARKTLNLATYGDPIVDGKVWEEIKAGFEKRYPQYELKVTVTAYVDYINKLTEVDPENWAPVRAVLSYN